MERLELLSHLQSIINVNGHILGVAVGNGMITGYTISGGADLLLSMNAGRFRQMGHSAFSAFFGYSDTNQMVVDFSAKEILPVANGFPVISGIFMQDPVIHLYDFLKETKEYGFSGICNYPTTACFNGRFRDALEASGLGYEKEIEGIRLAHFLDLFTLAYVCDEKQAVDMVKAGADAICVHLGVAGGGTLGANKVVALEVAMEVAENIFRKADEINPQVIKTMCSGPIQTPIDAHMFFSNTRCQGVMLGSAIERIPVERAVINTTKAFKSQGDFDDKNIISKVLNGEQENLDYAQFMQEYVQKNYSKTIRLKDLSVITHMSVSRLCVVFKEKTGVSFTQYLIRYRMKKACEYLSTTAMQIKEISSLAGYDDYSQFVKIFKKTMGMTPLEYRRLHINKIPQEE